MMILDLGQHRDPWLNQLPAQFFGRRLEDLVTAGEGHRRQVVPIRLPPETVTVPAHSDPLFGLVVVWRNLLVVDRPVDIEPVLARGLEVEIREAPRETPPVERLSTNDPCSHPGEGLSRIGRVGILRILDVEVAAELAGGVLHPLFGLLLSWSPEPAIHRLVGELVHIEVTERIDQRSGLKNKNLKTTLGQLLGRHSTRGPGADDDGIILLL